MSKHLCILVSPDGDEFYDAYGPMTTLRDQATRFETVELAMGAANQRYGRHSQAFWNSERSSQQLALERHRGWTNRTEEVADDDLKREGHFVVDYRVATTEEGSLYAHGDGASGFTWSTEKAGCHLWPTRQEALQACKGMPKIEDRRYAIDAY